MQPLGTPILQFFAVACRPPGGLGGVSGSPTPGPWRGHTRSLHVPGKAVTASLAEVACSPPSGHCRAHQTVQWGPRHCPRCA